VASWQVFWRRGDKGIALCGNDDYLIGKLERTAMVSLFQILLLILGIARFFIIVHFVMSWLISFNVLNVRQPFVAQVWFGLQRLLEPLYAPIRRMLPNMGGLDLSPLVALVAIYALEIILRNNISVFY
jgi:YggT family protein